MDAHQWASMKLFEATELLSLERVEEAFAVEATVQATLVQQYNGCCGLSKEIANTAIPELQCIVTTRFVEAVLRHFRQRQDLHGVPPQQVTAAISGLLLQAAERACAAPLSAVDVHLLEVELGKIEQG